MDIARFSLSSPPLQEKFWYLEFEPDTFKVCWEKLSMRSLRICKSFLWEIFISNIFWDLEIGIFEIFSFGKSVYFIIQFHSKINVLRWIQGTCVFSDDSTKWCPRIRWNHKKIITLDSHPQSPRSHPKTHRISIATDVGRWKNVSVARSTPKTRGATTFYVRSSHEIPKRPPRPENAPKSKC